MQEELAEMVGDSAMVPDRDDALLCQASNIHVRTVLDKVVKVCGQREMLIRDVGESMEALPERYVMRVMKVGLCLMASLIVAVISVALIVLDNMGVSHVSGPGKYVLLVLAAILGLVWIVEYVTIRPLKQRAKNSETEENIRREELLRLEHDNSELLSRVPLTYQDSLVLRSLVRMLDSTEESTFTEIALICDDDMHQAAVRELKQAQADQIKQRIKLNQKSVIMDGLNSIQMIRLLNAQNK